MLLEKVISKNLKAMFEYSIPLYTAKGEREPYNYHLCGTGIFMKTNNKVILITAAHVLDETESNTIHVFDKNGKPLYLEGDKYTSPRKEGDTAEIRKDDPVDIGVIEVPWSDDELGCYRFCTPDMMYAHEAKAETLYVFSGFPSTRNRPKWKSKVRKVVPYFSMGDIVSEDKYAAFEKEKFSRKYNIIINFDSRNLKNLKNERTTTPEQYGMSGGPVWIFEPSKVRNENFPFRLAGIGIEWHKKEKCLIGTSIIAAKELMEKGPLKEKLKDTEK